jgi:hypothetical protein
VTAAKCEVQCAGSLFVYLERHLRCRWWEATVL